MEASVAADAAAQETTTEATPEQPDVAGALQQFSKDIESLRGELASIAPQEPAVEEPTEPENLDFGFLDETRPGYDPQQALNQLGELIRTEAKNIAAQEITPLRQDLQQKEQERGLEDLSSRYPQLQDAEVAKELLDTAAQFVDQEGLDPNMAFHPGFLETMYLAARARQQNTSSGDEAATANLEGAGGASPGGAQGAEQPTAKDWAASVAPKRHALFTNSG